MSEIETIKHAAVIANNGMIFLGKCHAYCFAQACNIGIKTTSKADHQGFMTSKGHFVNRVQAAKIAVDAGQVASTITVLFSEDLWSPQAGGKFNYDYVRGYE